MDPLVLVDEVVKDYWKDEIKNYLSVSPYDCFCKSTGSGPHRLLSVKEVFEKLPLPSRAEERDRPVWEFFEFDEIFNSEFSPYKMDDLFEDITVAGPMFDAVEDLRSKPQNTEWSEIVCDLSFFDADTMRETNEFNNKFDWAFDFLVRNVAFELAYQTKPLVDYTYNPAKKIWEKTTVDGVPLFEFLGI